MSKRNLSQEEIDVLFSGVSGAGGDASAAVSAFDFSRLDRIPKSQIRTVRRLHESFVRSLATSLGTYLRMHVSPNLVSLEQISYGEFVEGLESPTCLVYVGLRPFEGAMVMEIARPLVFTAVELLLGGAGSGATDPRRKLTDIERQLVQNLLRVMLVDFHEAWRTVAEIDFDVQTIADEPQDLRVLTNAEAVVAVAIEVTIGTTTGMINMAIPSIFIKRLRDRFDQLQSVMHVESEDRDRMRVEQLVHAVDLGLEIRIDGGHVAPDELAALEVGDILTFDHPLNRPLAAYLNGEPALLGRVADTGARLTFRIESAHDAD